jgi:hypothetical protein
MARRYSVGGRFSQPDPYGGSYNFGDPQSMNRYAYTKNDPVNFRDPSGLDETSPLTRIRRINQPVVSAPTAFVAPTSYDQGEEISGFFGSGTEGMMVELPSDPQNTPEKPIESDSKITACHITVTPGYQVGDEFLTGQFGRAFNVDISVQAGGIKQFSNWQRKSAGEWTVEQWAWERFNATGDKGVLSSPGKLQNDNPKKLKGNFVTGNVAHWFDAPGYGLNSPEVGHLQSYEGWANFYIKAYNKQGINCVVEFGIHKVYNDGTPEITLRRTPY